MIEQTKDYGSLWEVREVAVYSWNQSKKAMIPLQLSHGFRFRHSAAALASATPQW
jgi:hypothetical protein